MKISGQIGMQLNVHSSRNMQLELRLARIWGSCFYELSGPHLIEISGLLLIEISGLLLMIYTYNAEKAF